MWGWLIVIGIVVALSARGRGMSYWPVWGLFAGLLPVVGVPWYMARRDLLPGERREGGRAWNFARWFIVLWTLAIGIGYWQATRGVMSPADEALVTAAARAQAVALWLIGTAVALVLGFLFKTRDVEEGPEPQE